MITWLDFLGDLEDHEIPDCSDVKHSGIVSPEVFRVKCLEQGISTKKVDEFIKSR